MNKHYSCYLLSIILLWLAGPIYAGQLNVYTSDAKGFDTHTFWYDDGKEITVIDTQFVPKLTSLALEDIRSKSKNPITRVIITHPNPDKFNGLSVLHAAGAVSIASEDTANAMPEVHAYKKYFFVNIAKKFSNKTYPKFEAIKQTFKGQEKIQLKSGETITLFQLKNPGISSTQTVVRIDATGDLLVGDLIHHNAHPWLEGGIVNGKAQPNLRSWRQSLDELLTIEGVKTVYGGRGEFTDVRNAVKAQQQYLKTIGKITNEYIADLGGKREELFDAHSAGKHHKAIQALAVKSFPEYQLPYMVKYGVYGLAQQIAGNY
jgi:glyoxylase-like metal-dependent hydrolase (beta-lactamase superfamily II)